MEREVTLKMGRAGIRAKQGIHTEEKGRVMREEC